MNREPTDRDKFNDDQEFLGSTTAPAAGAVAATAPPSNED